MDHEKTDIKPDREIRYATDINSDEIELLPDNFTVINGLLYEKKEQIIIRGEGIKILDSIGVGQALSEDEILYISKSTVPIKLVSVKDFRNIHKLGENQILNVTSKDYRGESAIVEVLEPVSLEKDIRYLGVWFNNNAYTIFENENGKLTPHKDQEGVQLFLESETDRDGMYLGGLKMVTMLAMLSLIIFYLSSPGRQGYFGNDHISFIDYIANTERGFEPVRSTDISSELQDVQAALSYRPFTNSLEGYFDNDGQNIQELQKKSLVDPLAYLDLFGGVIESRELENLVREYINFFIDQNEDKYKVVMNEMSIGLGTLWQYLKSIEMNFFSAVTSPYGTGSRDSFENQKVVNNILVELFKEIGFVDFRSFIYLSGDKFDIRIGMYRESEKLRDESNKDNEVNIFEGIEGYHPLILFFKITMPEEYNSGKAYKNDIDIHLKQIVDAEGKISVIKTIGMFEYEVNINGDGNKTKSFVGKSALSEEDLKIYISRFPEIVPMLDMVSDMEHVVKNTGVRKISEEWISENRKALDALSVEGRQVNRTSTSKSRKSEGRGTQASDYLNVDPRNSVYNILPVGEFPGELSGMFIDNITIGIEADETHEAGGKFNLISLSESEHIEITDEALENTDELPNGIKIEGRSILTSEPVSYFPLLIKIGSTQIHNVEINFLNSNTDLSEITYEIYQHPLGTAFIKFYNSSGKSIDFDVSYTISTKSSNENTRGYEYKGFSIPEEDAKLIKLFMDESGHSADDVFEIIKKGTYTINPEHVKDIIPDGGDNFRNLVINAIIEQVGMCYTSNLAAIGASTASGEGNNKFLVSGFNSNGTRVLNAAEAHLTMAELIDNTIKITDATASGSRSNDEITNKLLVPERDDILTREESRVLINEGLANSGLYIDRDGNILDINNERIAAAAILVLLLCVRLGYTNSSAVKEFLDRRLKVIQSDRTNQFGNGLQIPTPSRKIKKTAPVVSEQKVVRDTSDITGDYPDLNLQINERLVQDVGTSTDKKDDALDDSSEEKTSDESQFVKEKDSLNVEESNQPVEQDLNFELSNDEINKVYALMFSNPKNSISMRLSQSDEISTYRDFLYGIINEDDLNNRINILSVKAGTEDITELVSKLKNDWYMLNPTVDRSNSDTEDSPSKLKLHTTL